MWETDSCHLLRGGEARWRTLAGDIAHTLGTCEVVFGIPVTGLGSGGPSTGLDDIDQSCIPAQPFVLSVTLGWCHRCEPQLPLP